MVISTACRIGPLRSTSITGIHYGPFLATSNTGFHYALLLMASITGIHYGPLLMVLRAVFCFSLLLTAYAVAPAESGIRNTGVYVIYSKGGGMDRYESGDRYGHKLELHTDGSYSIYQRIYQKKEGKGTVEDTLMRQGKADPARMDSLRSLVGESDFFTLPQRLPDVSPLEVEFREPAETITIIIRKEDGTMHRVQSYMGVAQRHYPERFIAIHRFLRVWLQELMME